MPKRIHATPSPAMTAFIEAAAAARGVPVSKVVVDLLALALGTRYPDPSVWPELLRKIT